MIMREQDSQLEEVGQAIGNLRQMGEMINDELESQNECVGGRRSRDVYCSFGVAQ